MVKEWNGMWVHTSEFEPKAPQLMPHEHSPDPQALEHPRVARDESASIVLLDQNPFVTYASGSGIINVYSPNNKRSTGDTVRFRGAPFVSSSTDKFVDCENIDGITGATICRDAGYTITAGKYVSGSTDSDETDWFYFTASTNATTGGIKGGGYPVSAGPVTISA
jgi:hypothetical protein